MTVGFDDSMMNPNVFTTRVNARIRAAGNVRQVQEEKDDSILSNQCTDGKDDGKVGLFNAAGHIVKGVAKTGVEMIEGCFLDEKGDFSVGKTLLTVATGAACIAFPPLGLAACAIGGVAGAAKIGSGIYNAMNAKTDKEAKLAWQNVGGGALIAGSSAIGGRASLSAIKSTSTAGELGGAALSELGENASLAERAIALGKDSLSSVKNNFSQLKDGAGSKIASIRENRQLNAKVDELVTLEQKATNAKAKQAKGEILSQEEIQAVNDWEKQESILNQINSEYYTLRQKQNLSIEEKEALANYENIALVKADEKIQFAQLKQGLETELKNIKNEKDKDVANQLRETLIQQLEFYETKYGNKGYTNIQNVMKEEILKQKIAIEKSADNPDKALIAQLQDELNQYSTIHKAVSSVTEPITNSNTAKVAGNFTEGVSNASGIGNKAKTLKSNMSKENANKLYEALSEDGRAIWVALTKENPDSVIAKYGYNNVLAVISVADGITVSSQSV